MVILGIDPGTTRVGYGLIRKEGGAPALIAAGILKVTKSDKTSMLEDVRAGISKLCLDYQPDMMAIEKLYFSKNQKTALAVAEARGVILLAARTIGLNIQEYSPTEVKAGITGYGGADKKAVLKMVRLTLKVPDLAVIDDASDALAIAIVAGQDLRAAPFRGT